MGQITPNRYVCYRSCEALTVDGHLTEPSWKRAPWTPLFADIEGDAGPLPRFGTRVMMLWDDDFFYFGVDMEEPHVWGTLTKRDSVICQDNDFEIFVDPDGDGEHYMEFEINPLNTVWDLYLDKAYNKGGKADHREGQDHAADTRGQWLRVLRQRRGMQGAPREQHQPEYVQRYGRGRLQFGQQQEQQADGRVFGAVALGADAGGEGRVAGIAERDLFRPAIGDHAHAEA